MKIGFIGLGIMGTPMAGHLIKGGRRPYLHTLHALAAGIDRRRRPGLRQRQGSGAAAPTS